MRKEVARLRALADNKAVLPTRKVLPLRTFHKCTSTGIMTAVAATNAMGFNNCNNA